MSKENSNKPLETVGDEALEARIVAWVLGEASAFEAAELEELCEKDPEVALFARRMRMLDGFIRDDSKEPARLSDGKRAKLLEAIGAGDEAKAPAPRRDWRRAVRQRLLPIAAVLVLLVVVGLLAMPGSLRRLAPLAEMSPVKFQSSASGDAMMPLMDVAEEEAAARGSEVLPNELIEGTPRPIILPKARPSREPAAEMAPPSVTAPQSTTVAGGIASNGAVAMDSIDAIIPKDLVSKPQGGRGPGDGKMAQLEKKKDAQQGQPNLSLGYNSDAREQGVVTERAGDRFYEGGAATDGSGVTGLSFGTGDDYGAGWSGGSGGGGGGGDVPLVGDVPALGRLFKGASDQSESTRSRESGRTDANGRFGIDADADARFGGEAPTVDAFRYSTNAANMKAGSGAVVDLETRSEGLGADVSVDPFAPAPEAAPIEEVRASAGKPMQDKEMNRLHSLSRLQEEAVRAKGEAQLGLEKSARELDELKLRGRMNQTAPGNVRGEASNLNAAREDLLRQVDQAWDEAVPPQKALKEAETVDAKPLVTDGRKAAEKRQAQSPDPLPTPEPADASDDASSTWWKSNALDAPNEPEPSAGEGEERDGEEVRRKLSLGTGHYNLGDFKKAEEAYKNALRVDPYNAEARRGLEKVEAAQKSYYRAAYDQTRAGLLAQVDESWEMETLEAEETLEQERTEVLDLMAEISASEEPFSTFSLHVSDASFKLASAALQRGERPDPESIRPEEFYNAFDYGDPAPSAGEPVACVMEQAAHPAFPQRNLLRVAVRTGASGRAQSVPLNLTLLLDNSGSMERGDRAEGVARAVEQLSTLLKPGDQVTVAGFSRTPRLLADRLDGGQAAQLNDLVRQVPAEGGTNLEQALVLGEELATRQFVPGAQNRMVLFTDGAANLGDADPESLNTRVETLRQNGIAFDAAGFGADGLNDRMLERLTRNGNGRYYVVDDPAEAGEGFANKLAGAFRPAAENVKVQVVFNPDRVGQYKLIGFEEHRLKKEDFRDDTVDAAEMAAEEAGVALYQMEVLPDGEGEIGEVRVRFRDAGSGEMIERNWTIPYEEGAPAFDQAAESLQLAGLAAFAAEKLRDAPMAGVVDYAELAPVVGRVAAKYAGSKRVAELRQMIEALR